MKTKLCFMICALLLLALFAISCGGAGDTGSPQTDDPAQTSRSYTAKPKKTTTVKTTTGTTAENFDAIYAVAPPTLPGGEEFEIIGRVGFEDWTGRVEPSDAEHVSNLHTTAEGAVYGKALAFSPLAKFGGRINELKWLPKEDKIRSLGSKGFMWYVDISRVELIKPMHVGMECYVYYDGWLRETDSVGGIAHYYQDGEWHQALINSDRGGRVEFPEKFKGWVYAPYTSYHGLYISLNDQGVTSDKYIGYVRFYLADAVCDPDNPDPNEYVILDEILLVG